MTKLRDITAVLDDLAPLRYAESWDNVGLLVGDPSADVTRILVTVDYTAAVAEEARAAGVELVVAYHPPMFAAVKRAPNDALWVDAIRRGVALYSPHTALDVAKDGTNDFLADACNVHVTERRAIRPHNPKDAQFKLIVFTPNEALDAVSAAIFGAGAGRIGAYTQCSFRLSGTGTFFGEEGTNPAVGEKGKLETVDEVRVETVVPISKVDSVIAAMRKAHPYEEPAFDLVRLAAPPEGASIGLGRIGPLVAETSRADLVSSLKKSLGVSHVLVSGPIDKTAKRVAVAAGAGGELLEDAIRAKADVFVTGEIRHHDALGAARRGVTVIAALHSNSERAAVRAYAKRIAERVKGVEVTSSTSDADPFVVV